MRNKTMLIDEYNDWTLKDFELEVEPLGKGGFGTVYRAKCLRPGYENQSVAIKRIRKDVKTWKYVKEEIRIHKQLKHPNIVECYTTFEEQDYVYLVLELCKQTLSEFLKKDKVLEIIAINIIEQIVKGMLYLHKKKFLHRDISIGNILLTSDMKVKICDFGFVTPINKPLTSVLGTRPFMCPEIKDGQAYDSKSDSYSLGVVIFVVLGGKLPMDKDVINDKHFSPQAVNLMKDLLEEDSTNRVGVDEVLKYDFFNEYRGKHSKSKNFSLRNKDSGLGSINSLSSSGKNQHRSLKYFDSGLDSFNSNLIESKKSHCFPNAYQGNSKTSYRTRNDNFSQNSKERLHNVSEEKQRRERTYFSPEQPSLTNYETQNLYAENNLLKRIPPISQPDRKERSVSEERRRHELICNSLRTTRNRSFERRSQQCSPHEETESFSYSHPFRSNTQTEICNDFCKFKHSIYEDNYSSHQSSVPIVSVKKIFQEKNSLSHQENLVLNSNKHSSCSNQSKKNIPKKKSQLGSSCAGQNLERLNAQRLRPHRYPYKKIAVISILENEDVCVEWLKTKKKKLFVSQVLHISGKTDMMYAFQPKHCLVGPQPPPKPGNPQEIQDFSFDALPRSYLKMYRIAKNIVDFVRAGTPKITCFKENFKFVMMENYPDPDIDMEFFDGGRIKQRSGIVSVIDKSGTIVKDMDDHFKAMHGKFMEMRAWCRQMEEKLETLNIPFNYPIMFGDSTKYHSKKNTLL